MVRHPNQTVLQRPQHSVEEKRRDIERLRRRIAELEAFDPTVIQKRFGSPELTALEAAIDETLSAVFGHNTVEYHRYGGAASLDNGPVTMRVSREFGGGHRDDSMEARQYVQEGQASAISLLQQATRGLEEEIELEAPKSQSREPAVASRKVFVVHGHDEAAKQAMARFLEKIELEAIILHEQPSQGLTIIEKFETHASQVAFAVVLLTPDDLEGTVSTDVQGSRARQNVIFELGYFVGKLGRGRACLMRKGEVEIPSDLFGVIYTEMDPGEGWKLKLLGELKAAGLTFDANKAWS